MLSLAVLPPVQADDRSDARARMASAGCIWVGRCPPRTIG